MKKVVVLVSVGLIMASLVFTYIFRKSKNSAVSKNELEIADNQKTKPLIVDVLPENTIETDNADDNSKQQEITTVYQEIDALGYQNEDILKVNYRKNSSDGYSWRTREMHYDKNDTVLSKDKLMSTIWLLDEDIDYSFQLLFYADDYFMIGSYHTGPSAFGKYKIENGKLILLPIDYDARINFYSSIFTSDEIICDLKSKSENVHFDNELLLNGVRFFPNGCYKPNGSSAVVGSTNVIVERTTKVLTDNVKFRTAPNTKAETQVSEVYGELFYNLPNWKETDCLIKGTAVSVYARTETPETIDGITACWYYVSMPTISEYNQYGWIFGGWFENYDENKEDEYHSIMKKQFE